MALDSTKVDVAVTGAVSFAPTATAAPTDAVTALPGAWRDLGYISEDGVVEARDLSTEKIVAWQNSDVVRSVVTEADMTIKFMAIETNLNSLEAFYGAAVDTTSGKVDVLASRTGGRRSWVVDYVDGTKLVRLYVPSGELRAVDEVKLANDGDPVSYGITIAAYPVVVSSVLLSARKWYSALDLV